MLGNLLDPANPFVTSSTCTGTLATGASCEIKATRTVLTTDPDPLKNTVTVHYNPSGFPNDVTDSDDHSVNLFQPSVSVDKTGDTLSKVGDAVNYTITVTNTSSSDSPNLVSGTIVDTLLGNLLNPANPFVTSSDCAATLATTAGVDSCTIHATRTVLAGDPDPLPNTVTVHYNPSGFPNDVTDSDDHSVNLFQPSVSVDKTGDTLSKVGDAVNYTITVTNTSSSDSPNLVSGTIVDTLLGNLLNPANPFVTSSDCAATLATTAGVDSCTIHATRTVLAGDPDPLPNTVTVHYNPSGFPNDVTDSDDHSVNLFTPSVAVTKQCSPASVTVGQTVTFTCSILNTSSSDAPNLILDSVTDVRNPGNVVTNLTATATANGCGSLAPAASCSFTYTATATTVGTLTNTVTAHYHPLGFPNDITDDGTCSVQVTGGEGCTPGVW